MNDAESNADDRPIAAYSALSTLYSVVSALVFLRLLRNRSDVPDRVGPADVALLGIATYKLSRTITKDKVTAPLRAPFTEYQGEAGPGEVSEAPRGAGLRHAIGELLVCPYCIAQWVATAFVAAFAAAPRAARFVATIFAAVTISDFLQIVYKLGEDKLQRSLRAARLG